ncbi:hypothetical protein D9613_001093 [Agrocybe pediades]|uniref:BTB domain-containing protein n=1 Tax=Agrocybe pediades TaxID=84607 RepID=A0A8H4VUM2_9AGAR|nr:hypothetical protein D9613_001093 [Agrocybe pediades]
MECTIPSISTPTPVLRDFFNSYNMATIYVKVENVVFAIPRYILNFPGSPFEMMFKLPQPGDGERKEGASEQNPIVIEGVAADDFEAFLHAFHSLPGNAPTPKFAVGGEDYWLAVLKLATMWRYGDLHKRAVEQMNKNAIVSRKTPLEMIYLGRKYSVPAWVKDGYVTLCSQEHLKLEDLAQPSSKDLALDWKTIATLLYIWGCERLPLTINKQWCDCKPMIDQNLIVATVVTKCRGCGPTKKKTQESNYRAIDASAIPNLISRHFRQELSGLNDNFDL